MPTNDNKQIQRNVILHLHFLKNAGSTMDYILQRNFKESLAFLEGGSPSAKVPCQKIINYFCEHPEIKAVSSHQALYPVPDHPNLKIYPIFFLRHPLDRVGSVYSFERRLNLYSRTVQLARGDIKDYIRFRLDYEGMVIQNFQVSRILNFASIESDSRNYLEEAKQCLRSSPFFGIVERFDDSLILLKKMLEKPFPGLDYSYQKVNVSPDREKTLEERVKSLEVRLGESLFARVVQSNLWDLELYDFALRLFDQRLRAAQAESK